MQPTDTTSDSPQVDFKIPKPVLHKAIAASAMGNAVEWFDYGAYTYLATHIEKTLFPTEANGMLWTLAAFAVSFLIRPLGGMFWGPLGDRIGRKSVMAMTIIFMASSTVLIGVIPSYASIGIWAPVILYVLRILQGFSAGGEYGGAATFMAEYSPANRRGMYGSFLEVGTLSGFTAAALIALLMNSVVSADAMADWGWRVPFFVALPLGYVGMYLRTKMEDSPVFREIEDEAQARNKKSSRVYKDLLTTYLKPLLILCGLVIALNVVEYTFLTFTPIYLQDSLGMSPVRANLVPTLGMIVMAILLPFFGRLSDTVGRRPMWLFSCISLIIFIVPLYTLMATGLTGAIVSFTIIGLLFAPQLSTISATFPAMFPTFARFAGVAIGYNVATSIFGGTAPLATQYLIDLTGNKLMPGYYMMGACVIGVIAAFFLLETKGESLRGTEMPGTEQAYAEQQELAEQEANSEGYAS